MDHNDIYNWNRRSYGMYDRKMYYIGDRMAQLHYEYPEMEKSTKMWLNYFALGKNCLVLKNVFGKSICRASSKILIFFFSCLAGVDGIRTRVVSSDRVAEN